MPGVLPEESRFEPDPDELVEETSGLPDGWSVGVPDPADRFASGRVYRWWVGVRRPDGTVRAGRPATFTVR